MVARLAAWFAIEVAIVPLCATSLVFTAVLFDSASAVERASSAVLAASAAVLITLFFAAASVSLIMRAAVYAPPALKPVGSAV